MKNLIKKVFRTGGTILLSGLALSILVFYSTRLKENLITKNDILRWKKEAYSLADKDGSHFLEDSELYQLAVDLTLIKEGETFLSRGELESKLEGIHYKFFREYLQSHKTP